MSGIGLVLNIAKDALLSQQYAMDVVSHNIANVSTEGYSRQVAVFEANDAAPYAGLVFGRGVSVGDIVSTTNSFLENRLHTATCDLSMMSEKETFLGIIETIFSEKSDSSLSNQFNEFWNSWNDLNNNPSGMPERNILAEYGALLSQSFRDTTADLTALSKEVNQSISAGVDTVNQILEQIANVNGQIQLVRITGNPNDLIDKRNSLINSLSSFMDINTFDDDDGTVSITTNKGFVLVNKKDSYLMEFDGTDINWQGTTNSITNGIQGGKIGAWLDIRDESIPQYQADLNELAKSTAWEINKLHSQGVGLTGFTSLSGTYRADDTSAAMGDAGLDFSEIFKNDSFNLRVYDDTGAYVNQVTISVDADSPTMFTDLAAAINSDPAVNGDINATVTADGVLQIQATTLNYTFTAANDSSFNVDNMDISTDLGYKGSDLDYADKITDGSFKLWIYDEGGDVAGGAPITIPVDADKTSMFDLMTTINGLTEFNASIKDGALNIEIDSATSPDYTFAFSDDDSNILAALGINTFFSGSDAAHLEVNQEIVNDKGFITAGTISNNVENAVSGTTNTSTGILTTSGYYTGTTDSTYEIRIDDPALGTFSWKKDSGGWNADVMAGPPGVSIGTEGVTVTFNGATTDYAANDTFTIEVTATTDTNGDYFPGDNTNALNISNLQYNNVTVKQWVYSREDGAASKDITTSTLDDYLHQMVGRIGIESQSVQREREYNQSIMEQVSQTRDNLSAVSLDEEMANLIKYQQAYAAAAKLITTASEMLDSIIQAV